MAVEPSKSPEHLAFEFHALIGYCIVAWSSVDEVLFSIFRHCVGPIEQSAIIYYRVPGLDARFGLTDELVKDPYQFDFLMLRQAAHERDVERGLIARVKDLLLELGKEFSFIASQHHLEVGGQDFYVDLLFYHRRLRCLIAVDPKTGPFRPEHAGKMNFYLAAHDDREREPGENPSIGLILCREHNRVVVEYALRGVDAPVGVARYQLLLSETLPKDLAGALPTQDDLAPGLPPPPGRDDE